LIAVLNDYLLTIVNDLTISWY